MTVLSQRNTVPLTPKPKTLCRKWKLQGKTCGALPPDSFSTCDTCFPNFLLWIFSCIQKNRMNAHNLPFHFNTCYHLALIALFISRGSHTCICYYMINHWYLNSPIEALCHWIWHHGYKCWNLRKCSCDRLYVRIRSWWRKTTLNTCLCARWELWSVFLWAMWWTRKATAGGAQVLGAIPAGQFMSPLLQVGQLAYPCWDEISPVNKRDWARWLTCFPSVQKF